MNNFLRETALLLERVSAAAKEIEDQYRDTGLAYNIFKVSGIGTREVQMCRVLADLLNPKGLHRQGSAYLTLFMDIIVKPLNEKAGMLNTDKARTTTEYTTDQGRFIDIVIDDGTVFIPIEAKIYADEQEQQLTDYAAFSRKMNIEVGFIPVLFLTPSGYESVEASKDDYIPISFNEHIIPWLEKCLELGATDKALPIREVLKQYIRAIKSFCGKMEDEVMENAINTLILESKEYYATAVSIARVVAEIENKTQEIFSGKIYDLVKSKFTDTKYYVYMGWRYFEIQIGNNCQLSINYDISKFAVERVDIKKPVTAETREKIRKVMSGITGKHGYHNDAGNVWISEETKYPDLADIDDWDVYKYELYRIYAKNPQSVADKIALWITELKNI